MRNILTLDAPAYGEEGGEVSHSIEHSLQPPTYKRPRVDTITTRQRREFRGTSQLSEPYSGASHDELVTPNVIKQRGQGSQKIVVASPGSPERKALARDDRQYQAPSPSMVSQKASMIFP